MIRPSSEIRSATPGEMPHAVAAIVAAFLTDPLARFAWPSPHDHLRALWLPPGVHPNGEALERVLRDTAMPAHLDDLLAIFEQMEHSHPEEPHWYLPLIGVEPNAQGA